MEKKSEGVIEGTSRIVSDPYYFLHLMAFFSYLPIRTSAAQYTSNRLLDREIQSISSVPHVFSYQDLSHNCYVDRHYILAQQPAFSRLGTAKKLTPMQLEDLLSDGTTTTKYWLIEFYACSSSKCVRSSRCFPELSGTRVNFCLLEPLILDFSLILQQSLEYLSPVECLSFPRNILFEKGLEVSRFPDFYVDAAPSLPITKKLLCQHFELDRPLLDCINGS